MTTEISAESALARTDPAIARLIEDEARRQRDSIRLIPSENYASRAVIEATGSVLTNKYSEGYPGRRYYEGQRYIDQIEELAIDRARQVFHVDHANVQPYSGSVANLAVYLAFAQPGDTIMGMGLPMGGHLTHGHNVSVTGKWFRAVQYGVRRDTGQADLDQARALARRHRATYVRVTTTATRRRETDGAIVKPVVCLSFVSSPSNVSRMAPVARKASG